MELETDGVSPARRGRLMATVTHVWMPPSVQVIFERFKHVIGYGHVSGLQMRH